ncbi:LOW QUALITY PROTEIN: hypothetical protein PHPALM_31166 [Phytophthora palmivora]|uniref:DUF7869 domain-containing protein n=1 Tax=Phytophthora palmivora TaxID=4796 RepID=A0A2P4X3A2_9STRA|nr:LOW QUALITY PROTEIN: hypothetical protein PHPALM_31166 [Phytophthora palmivora]
MRRHYKDDCDAPTSDALVKTIDFAQNIMLPRNAISWLEHIPNFEKCFGTTGKTSVGKQSTKTDGFKAMAAAVGKSSKGKFDLKPLQMRSRFATYKTRYTRAKAYKETTGAGHQAKKGSTEVISMLHTYARMRNIYSMVPGQKKWHVYADNCGGQVKNCYVLQFLLFMVHTKSLQGATLSFSVKGRTKNHCDRHLGYIKRCYAKRDMWIMNDIERAVKKEDGGIPAGDYIVGDCPFTVRGILTEYLREMRSYQ